MLGLVAIVIAEAGSTAAEASNQYQASQRQLDSQLAGAAQDGYTRVDLAPIYDGEAAVAAEPEPIWVGDRAAFYRVRLKELASLRSDLQARRAQVFSDAQSLAAVQLAAADGRIARDDQIGVDPADLAPLRASLATLKAGSSSSRLADLRQLAAQAQALVDTATQVGAAQELENAAIQAAAGQLKASKQGDAAAIRQAGLEALAAARNDATVANFLDREQAFKGPLAAVTAPYGLAERFGAKLSATDVDALAGAAAAVQRYADRVHSALMGGMPGKAIVLSYQAQELWAYEGAKQVLDTLVTTGRPQLPTDIGPMSALWKSSPWTMHSPWPKDSPWYYPDTVVQQVVWFTNTGEGLHDANWEYDWQYGPGGQYGGGASHGCVHLPAAAENFVFHWTDLGTPVIVYPGDGSPVANQVAQITVDQSGQPTTGPKGA